MTYHLIAVKTRLRTEGGSIAKFRANPLPGQGVDTKWNTECSVDAREKNPEGTVFLIWAKKKQKELSTPHLYTYHGWEHLVLHGFRGNNNLTLDKSQPRCIPVTLGLR